MDYSSNATPTLSGASRLRRLYERLGTQREPILRRARYCARITIPHLLPENSETAGGDEGELPEPYQSIGARGVNNLASKMLLALFEDKFFRLVMEPEAKVQAQDAQIADEIDDSLAMWEQLAMDEFETIGLRIKLYQAFRQLVCTGNALLHIPSKQPPRVYRLDSYVVERDPSGHVVRIVTRRRAHRETLPEAIRRKLPQRGMEEGNTSDGRWVEIFTGVELMERKGKLVWCETQEVDGAAVVTPVYHDIDRLPYIPLRMYAVDGEHYGRGIVEEYLGDLRTLEGLTGAMHNAAVAMARLLILVNPDGRTRISELEAADEGAFVPGHPDDVKAMQLDKMPDLQVPSREADKLERRLGLAFLLNSTVQRQAERVTAEEIRLVAQELEDTLGGVFSLLSADLQLPLVNVLLGRLRDQGALEALPEYVRPVIVTGLDALGRGHEAMRLERFIIGAAQTFGPEIMAYFHANEYLRRKGKAEGVDVEGLVKTQEDLAAERQAAEMAEMGKLLGPQMMEKNPEAASEALGGLLGVGA